MINRLFECCFKASSTPVLGLLGNTGIYRGKPMGGRSEMIPKEFNTNTTLEREVVAGENGIDFEL